jgi:hypothetical protein
VVLEVPRQYFDAISGIEDVLSAPTLHIELRNSENLHIFTSILSCFGNIILQGSGGNKEIRIDEDDSLDTPGIVWA